MCNHLQCKLSSSIVKSSLFWIVGTFVTEHTSGLFGNKYLDQKAIKLRKNFLTLSIFTLRGTGIKISFKFDIYSRATCCQILLIRAPRETELHPFLKSNSYETNVNIIYACQIGFKLGSCCCGKPGSCCHVIIIFSLNKPRDFVMTMMISVPVFLRICSKEGKNIENHQKLNVWKAYGRKIKMWLTKWWHRNN